jgi:DNA repair protein RadC
MASHQRTVRFRATDRFKTNYGELNSAEILQVAESIIAAKVASRGDCLSSPEDTKRWLRLHFHGLLNEQFSVIFLDAKHRVIAFETLFYGTIDASVVYPRVVAQKALTHNAAALIFAHNHPSGNPEPSQADINITRRLVDAMALLDIRVLDHFVVGDEITSFAEKGLL